MLINVTQALGEMCIVFPVSGGYYTLASRMLDQSFAFAMGWNYVLQWAVVLPLEIVSLSLFASSISLIIRSSLDKPFNTGIRPCL
jgi:amino acid permease